MSRILLALIAVLCVCSCQRKSTENTSSILVSSNYEIQYAKGFQVAKSDNYTHITIRNPWDTTSLLASYVLVPKGNKLPDNLPKGTLVRTPVGSAAITSSTQYAVLNELNRTEIITGVCEPHYMKQEFISQGVADGKIVNLGMAANPNTEALILLGPDIIFSDPVTGQSQASIEKTKLPIVQTSDYTEPHPLGRAEWIRFYSLFLGQEALADSLFAITEKSYNEIKEKVTVSKKPTVFIDTRYQGKWNMPGGNSYMAKLIADAGADYLWADDESTSFLPLSFETVLDKAGEGDIWLIRYYADDEMTYQSLQKEYKPYSYFKAFKDRKIYGCNNKYASLFEDVPIHPDYVLKDMAAMFHPDLFPDYNSKYFNSLKE